VVANLLAQFTAFVRAHMPPARLFASGSLLPALDLLATKIFARATALFVWARTRPALAWRPAGLRPGQLAGRKRNGANKNEKAFHRARVVNRQGSVQLHACFQVHASHIDYNAGLVYTR